MLDCLTPHKKNMHNYDSYLTIVYSFQVTTAVKFLTNPSVQRCTMESKERFLRNKGLNDAEIQRAIEKCGELIDLPSVTSEFMFFHHSRRSWFRDNVLPLIIYGGFAYGCYWFYKVSKKIHSFNSANSYLFLKSILFIPK